MKLNKRLASYPILISGDDDYVDSYFDSFLKQDIEFDKIKVSVDFSLENEGLKQLILDKKAGYAVHFECQLLSYRKLITTESSKVDYLIDLNDVTNAIEVSTYIIAMVDIPKYYNEKFNWAYGKEGVDITKGNVMAIGPTYTIDIDRSKDGLKKLSDIICIKQHEDSEKQELSVSIDGDIIMILVSENIKNQYFVHGKQYLYNIISMIMVPSMSYVLTCMKKNADNLREYRWFIVIEQLLNQNGVEINQLREDESSGKYSIYELSQKIFKLPIEKGIMELNRERRD